MTDRILFHTLFEAQVDKTPDRVAVIAGNERVTYRQLDERANRLAHALRDGYRQDTGEEMVPDTLIGLCAERGANTIAAVFAILKAGGAWVPLDPAYPVDRLTYMLADSAAPMVLVQSHILKQHAFLTEAGRRIVAVEQQMEPAVDASRPANINSPDDLVYVVYTSGSTGRPKGVESSHAAMLSRFEWMWRDYPFVEDEVCLAKTSLNFVDSFWEMLGGLLKGVPTVVADNITAKDPGALLELIGDHGVTRLIVVPSLAAAMLEEAKRTGGIGLEKLRYLTFSGEPLVSDLVRAARAINPDMTMLNLYGASETAADATFCDIRGADMAGKTVPIGNPVGDMRVHVLDDDMKPVTQGTEGELYVSGPGLARGYRNLPALTAEKFLDNPFVVKDSPDWPAHRRLFRSGDMVWQRPDGSFHYVGRKDFQIKVRGLRIEPGEIEAVLVEHPGVQSCAVAANDTDTGKRLVAYYVPNLSSPDGAVSAHELRIFVARTVADYMVPSLFVRMEALPLLPNGKLNRRALALPEGFQADTDYVAPATETECRLVEIWQEVLGLARVGTADDFFEIGGDSILSFRIAARAKELGMQLAPRDLKEAPTVAELARRTDGPSGIDIEAGKLTGEMPLSPMQRYYFSWAKPNPNKFNVGFIARLADPMDVPRLKAAFRHVIEHHDALRLRFCQDESGEWHQRFSDHESVYEVPVEEMDLPAGGPGSHLSFIEAEVARIHDTLDIDNGPVMRVGLFKGARPGEDHFFFVMHELVTDAMSQQITLEDLRRAYQQLGAGEAVSMPAKTTSYRQWVSKVQDYANTGATGEQWDYWLERGRDATPFPEDDDAPGALQSDILPFAFDVLDADTVRTLRDRLKGGFQGRLLDGIFTSLTLSANGLSGQRDLVFHKVAHGREAAIRDADVSRTVGWFITHTPITFRLPDGAMDNDKNLASAMESVSAQHTAIPDNGLGHSALRYYSDDPRVEELARYDEVRTLFQYIGDVWEHNYDGELFLVPDPSLTDVPDTVAAENLADYHLHVYAYLVNDAFRMKFFYTRKNYSEVTIRRMAALFTENMRRLMAL